MEVKSKGLLFKYPRFTGAISLIAGFLTILVLMAMNLMVKWLNDL